jgi:hypothetical protein
MSPCLTFVCDMHKTFDDLIRDLVEVYVDDIINNNNQVFYSQASWGKLEMKPHEQKNRYKTRAKKKGKTKDNKK